METNTPTQKLCYRYVSKDEVKIVIIQTLVNTKSLAAGNAFGKLIISDDQSIIALTFLWTRFLCKPLVSADQYWLNI